MGNSVGKPKDIWIVIYEKGIADAAKVQKNALKLVREHTGQQKQQKQRRSSTRAHRAWANGPTSARPAHRCCVVSSLCVL
jgi:hypothetical protein